MHLCAFKFPTKVRYEQEVEYEKLQTKCSHCEILRHLVINYKVVRIIQLDGVDMKKQTHPQDK